MRTIFKVCIIGSGPAGYTAAIYAARAGLKPILFQGKQPGGQLTITTDVENFPGYVNGIKGPDMMLEFQKQAERFGSSIKSGSVTNVNFEKRPFVLEINKKENIYAESVIIATGASAKWLGLDSEKRLYNKGVSACAVCDGYFYRNQDVAVVGGGDTAAEESLYLSNICNKVFLLVRSTKMRASKIMQERLKKKKNIQILFSSETKNIIGKDEVEGVEIINKQTNKEIKIPVKAFFVAIGHKPNTAIFKNQLKLDDQEYIIVTPGTTKTNIEGIYACGDVQDRIYRQAVTAAGTGCMAALDAERFLESQKFYTA